MKLKLLVFVWRHAILHIATLICIKPLNYNDYSLLKLVYCQEPNIFHLRIFWSAAYVPIASLQYNKMRHQRRLEIYVEYEYLFTIK